MTYVLPGTRTERLISSWPSASWRIVTTSLAAKQGALQACITASSPSQAALLDMTGSIASVVGFLDATFIRFPRVNSAVRRGRLFPPQFALNREM